MRGISRLPFASTGNVLVRLRGRCRPPCEPRSSIRAWSRTASIACWASTQTGCAGHHSLLAARHPRGQADIKPDRPVNGLHHFAHGCAASRAATRTNPPDLSPSRRDHPGPRQLLQHLGKKALRSFGGLGQRRQQRPLIGAAAWSGGSSRARHSRPHASVASTNCRSSWEPPFDLQAAGTVAPERAAIPQRLIAHRSPALATCASHPAYVFIITAFAVRERYSLPLALPFGEKHSKYFAKLCLAHFRSPGHGTSEAVGSIAALGGIAVRATPIADPTTT